MERGIFSKEVLTVIYKNIKIFAVTVAILFLGAGWKILSVPQEYRAISYFRYMGIEPGEITVKKDNNGTVTLIQYRLGEGNLDLQTLFRSPEFISIRGKNRATLTFDRGNGNHVLEVRGENRDEILEVSSDYMEKFLEKNRKFLQAKINSEQDNSRKERVIHVLENTPQSFPLFIEATDIEKIESRKATYLFFAFLTTVFIGIMMAFIAQVLREVREKK